MDDTKHYPGRLRAPPGDGESSAAPGPAGEAPAAAIRYLGPEIRNLRKARGMTLAAVAAASGLSVGYLSLLERDRATPSINALHAISRALGVTISWFFEAGETPEPERDIVVRRARHLGRAPESLPRRRAGAAGQPLRARRCLGRQPLQPYRRGGRRRPARSARALGRRQDLPALRRRQFRLPQHPAAPLPQSRQRGGGGDLGDHPAELLTR
jgi:transcriptional regulator with XRE-family HTH domain